MSPLSDCLCATVVLVKITTFLSAVVLVCARSGQEHLHLYGFFSLFLMRSASRGASPSRHHVPHFRPSLLYFYITLFHNLPDCQGAAVASPLPPPPFISSSAFTSLTPSPRPSLPLPLLQSGSAAARSLDAFTKKKRRKKVAGSFLLFLLSRGGISALN